MPPRTTLEVGRRVQICMPPSNDNNRDIVMPPLRGSTPQDSIMAKLDYLWTALDKLESRMDARDRRLGKLRLPQWPNPDPPYGFPDGGGADWDRQQRLYIQPEYQQPLHQQPDRYLPPPPYQTERHRPPMCSGFPRRQFLRPQYGPARQSSCWDKPLARAPRSSLTYEGSDSTYYSNHDWDFDAYDYEESVSDSDGYDEDFDVGYTRQPYNQLHSMPPQRPPYFTRDSYVQTQSSNPYSHWRTTHSNGQPWHKDRPLLPRSTSCCHPTTQLRQAAACLEQPAAEQQPLFQRPPSCRHPLSGTIDEDKDFRGEGKGVDEELCYETELIPNHHSSSLDQELDAHHKMEKNSNSLNWICSFLDEVDESKSSLLDDDYENKATFDDDELIEMEHQSVKVSEDLDLDLNLDLDWNLERESDSSSSPSCVDNSSQQRCWGLDDEDEVDGVDVLSQHQNLVQQMTVELKSCDIRCLPTICEDSVTPKMIEDLRPRKIDHMIRYKEVKETEAFASGKTRADSVLPRFLAGKGHRDLEVVYVGQWCLSWEILWWLNAETRELLDRDGEGRCSYNRTAKELQQFQVLAQRDEIFVGLVSNLDKKGTRLKEQMRSEECIVRKLRKHQERGWERTLGFLSVIAFDPGGDVSMLLLSSTLPVVSWFPP